MIPYVRKHKVLTAGSAFVALLLVMWAWSLTAPVRGKVDATIDVREGHYRVLGYGLADRSRSEYARCLRERYNIEYRTVAGCIVSESLISHVRAYHSVVAEAANRKFGHNVFQECAEQAETSMASQLKQTSIDSAKH